MKKRLLNKSIVVYQAASGAFEIKSNMQKMHIPNSDKPAIFNVIEIKKRTCSKMETVRSDLLF